jgi:predicted site-specific integrase-resolvase
MANWLNAKEAMDYLKIKSRTTFYRLVAEGYVKSYTLKGTSEKRYNQEELDQLMVPDEPEPGPEPKE